MRGERIGEGGGEAALNLSITEPTAWGGTPISPYFPLAEHIKPVNSYGACAAPSISCCEPGPPKPCMLERRRGGGGWGGVC